MNDPIFITWERHQRTRSLCKKLDIQLIELLSQKKGLARYADIIPQTIDIIKSQRPAVLFVQNPSIVLASLAVLLKYIFKYKLIVDAHNEAIEPFIHNNWVIRTVAKCLIAKANHTIVTNDILANNVFSHKGSALVVPDFLPDVPPRASLHLPNDSPCEITLICTYADDEPYEEIFKAVEALGSKVVLNVTGKIPEKVKALQLAGNIRLLGFLSEHDYWETLYKSHIILDLSTMNNCLVCGAYESLAIQKPLMLSKNNASLNLFGNYAVHVENTRASIQAGIESMIAEYGTQPDKIAVFKTAFLSNEQKNITEIKQLIHQYCSENVNR